MISIKWDDSGLDAGRIPFRHLSEDTCLFPIADVGQQVIIGAKDIVEHDTEGIDGRNL
jgi:hypothetical protein